MPTDLTTLYEAFGTGGLIVGALYLIARMYLPEFKRIGEAILRIATAVELLSQRVETAERRLAGVESGIGEIKEDMAALYESSRLDQPSRRRRTQPVEAGR